jgi:hypothetical protein
MEMEARSKLINMRANPKDQEMFATLATHYGKPVSSVIRLLAYQEVARIEERKGANAPAAQQQ